jgi:sulfite reductase beta subunit-like hemoprotein
MKATSTEIDELAKAITDSMFGDATRLVAEEDGAITRWGYGKGPFAAHVASVMRCHMQKAEAMERIRMACAKLSPRGLEVVANLAEKRARQS